LFLELCGQSLSHSIVDGSIAGQKINFHGSPACGVGFEVEYTLRSPLEKQIFYAEAHRTIDLLSQKELWDYPQIRRVPTSFP
jgi:hypothetical protein